MRDTIVAAIINRSVLTVTCGEFVRIIHPYLLYEASTATKSSMAGR